MEKKTTQLLSQINQKMKVAMLSASSYSWTLMPQSMVSKTLKAPTPVCRYYWAGMSSMWRKRRTKETKDLAQLGRARWTHTRSKRSQEASACGPSQHRAAKRLPHALGRRYDIQMTWRTSIPFMTSLGRGHWSHPHRFRQHRRGSSFIQMTWRTSLPFMTSLGRGHWKKCDERWAYTQKI